MRNSLKEQPKVSIITPTFNRVHFLTQTLEYILNLNYSNWEWIIIDDGSTDGTEEIILEYSKVLDKVNYFKRRGEYSKGPSGCRNQGINLACGEFIVFVDDDDIVHPDLLKITAELLIENLEASFCRYDKRPFRGNWKPELIIENSQSNRYSTFSRSDILKMITGEVPFACCTVMWRKKDLGEERFQENLSYAEEWEYYNRLILKNDFGISLDRVLYFNRKHPHSNTGEFWANNQVRRASKVEATLLIIEELFEKELINQKVSKYFIQLGFFLKSRLVINKILELSRANYFTKLKYKTGYFLYPVLRPLLRLKGKLINN